MLPLSVPGTHQHLFEESQEARVGKAIRSPGHAVEDASFDSVCSEPFTILISRSIYIWLNKFVLLL